MPRKKLSADEEALVDAIVRRKVRFLVLAEEHASAVRPYGRDVLYQACDEADRALAPKTGQEIMYPPRGTNMEEYYQKFEPALTANARTPFEHMFIAKMAMGLNSVLVSCEYACLSERAQCEVDTRFANAYRPHVQCLIQRQRQTANLRPTQIIPQRLPILHPIDRDAPRIQLQPEQVNEFLENFLRLHHKVFWDKDSDECYKIIDAHYSLTTPSIESYEVQLQECPSAVTYSFNDVREMLLRSSIVG